MRNFATAITPINSQEIQVLFVDDEPEVLTAYEMRLGRRFPILTAINADQAIEHLRGEKVGVVVADMKMPGRSGIDLLADVKQISPETVRMMLTGIADLKIAMEAINHGEVFRFLQKPCPPDQLAASIHAGLEQYGLIIARKELLNGTLTGSVGLLADVLSICAPSIFSRLAQVRRRVRELARRLCGTCSWELECAGAICLIGYVGLSDALIEKIGEGAYLSETEAEEVGQQAEIGARLIRRIPRMDKVANIVQYQRKNYDGTGFPRDSVSGDEIPIESRILSVCLDANAMELQGVPAEQALAVMDMRRGTYCPKVLRECAIMILGRAPVPESAQLRLQDIRPGLVLASPVYTEDGGILILAGTTLTEVMCERLRTFSRKSSGVREPISVMGGND